MFCGVHTTLEGCLVLLESTAVETQPQGTSAPAQDILHVVHEVLQQERASGPPYRTIRKVKARQIFECHCGKQHSLLSQLVMPAVSYEPVQ